MAHLAVKKISITISPGLLGQVDALAGHDYTTRSDIIRQALLQYIREHPPPAELSEKAESPTPEDFTGILAKYPHIDPNDRELLRFLQQQERQAEDTEV